MNAAGHGAPRPRRRRPGARRLARAAPSCCRCRPATEVGRPGLHRRCTGASEFLSGRSSTGERLAGVNALTTSAFCPISQAARAEARGGADRSRPSCRGRCWPSPGCREARALAAREALARADGAASPSPPACRSGRERAPACCSAPPPRWRRAERAAGGASKRLLGLGRPPTRLRYADRGAASAARRAWCARRRGRSPRSRPSCSAGDTSAEAWIKPLLQDELPAAGLRPPAAAPGPSAPVAVAARGRQVCTCFNVTRRRDRRLHSSEHAARAEQAAPRCRPS